MFPDWRLLSHKISFASLFLGHPICICCVTCMLWYRLASVGLIQSVIEIRHLSVIQTCHLSVIQTCHLSVIQTCQQLVYNRLPSASRTRWPSRQQTMGNEVGFLLCWQSQADIAIAIAGLIGAPALWIIKCGNHNLYSVLHSNDHSPIGPDHIRIHP